MRRLSILLLLLTPTLSTAADEPAEFAPEHLEFFEKQVRPLLAEHCHKCHGPQQQKGNLRLDSRAAVLAGGDSGPAIDLTGPRDSELLSAVNYDPSGYQMPPDGKLSNAEIATLTRWVELGAPWPIESSAAGDVATRSWEQQFNERRKHWSFQPLVRVAPPTVTEPDWCRTPIDRFVLSKLQAQQLPHAGEADRRTWLRRVTVDVTGLPPTPREIEAFLADEAPGAHDRVIDRLLSSPHFGERWGRHWLDLVRYAESRGHEFDYDIANPWPYRDYVIRALNADVPYDQFVVEHVAGDLLGGVESGELRVESDARRVAETNTGSTTSVTDQTTTHHSPLTTPSTLNSQLSTPHSLRLDPATGANESIVATGFWFLGEWVHSPVDIRQEEADRFENMIDVYSKSFLGLTVACARCHDHKFDPIPTTDFYALQGYLQSSTYQQARYEHWENNRRLAVRLRQLDDMASTAIAPVFARIVEAGAGQLDRLLVGSHDVLRPDLSRKESEAERLLRIAKERNVHPDRLRSWCSHLVQAAGDPADPFHVWGLLATGKLSDVESAAELLRAEPAGTEASRELDQWLAEAFVDQRLFQASDFRSDGIAYGRPGTGSFRVDLGSLPERPLRRIEQVNHVEYDPFLGDLPVHPSTMLDGGKLGVLERGGRTLRSPSFTIGTNRLWCEIRGGCHTYVVVDSHVLINGPLHGSLLADHPVPDEQPDGWRWISHDLSRYRGHRAHLEFVPKRGQPFSVRHVVLSDSIPQHAGDSEPSDAAHVGCPERLTLDSLAKQYQTHWQLNVTADHFPPGSVRSCHASVSLHAAEWARQHPELFGLDTDDARQQLAQVAAPLIDKRNELLVQLQHQSALAPVMLDGSGEDEYVFIRGNWKKRGETVPRRFLSAFGEVQSPGATVQSNPVDASASAALDSGLSALDSTTGSGRLDLALQMVDPGQTPIVARVIVNRIWQHYFGRGIVTTPDDFGHLGTPPTHPELLDWLATELIAHNWSQKHIHRLILQSATYRMASRIGESRGPRVASSSDVKVKADALDAGLAALDPSNTLLGRMNVKRMEGEVIRDSILAISGRLDDEMYGRSTPVHLTSFLEGRGRPKESGPVDGAGRRSLYIAVRRNFAEPFFQAFDFPNPHSTIGRRNVSNVPAQALALMNNPMVIEQCRVTAERLLVEAPGESIEARLQRIHPLIYARPPRNDELQVASDFLTSQAAALGSTTDDPRIWSDYIHVLLNAKEFVFVR